MIKIIGSVSTTRGQCNYQEDRGILHVSGEEGPMVLGVFDGHSTSFASDYCRRHMRTVVYQLISRKSLKKVDADLYLLGALYAVIMGVYVFFEICIINYRPIILYVDLEASFPSSHTMIVLCIMSTAIFQFNRRIHNNIVKKAVNGASILLIAITIIVRLISGVHWFTDIIGGLLIGTSLILFYIALVQILDKSQYVVQNQIDN